MKRRGWGCCGFAAVALLAAMEATLAESVPVSGSQDSRVRAAAYDAEQVYRIRGFVGYEIDLQFEPGESFVGLGAGDLEAISFQAQDNHLFIKPRAAMVGTNMTVLTSRRSYHFDYTASSARPKTGDPSVTYVLRFTYPALADGTGSVARLLSEAAANRPKNTDYWYCGSPSIKPIAAWDDGVHTRIRFNPRAEQPALFIANDDGTESLLNYGMEDGDVVVYRVVRNLIVRRGRLAGRIANKGFAGIGTRLESGTVSPLVERATGNEPP